MPTPITRSIRIAANIVLFGLLAYLPAICVAQNPFGEAPGAPATPATAPSVEELLGEKDPLVLAVKESKPQTADELLKATKMLMDYGREDAARTYAGQLVGTNPTPKTLAALVNDYGTAFFTEMRRNEKMAPEGPQLSALALDAAYKVARDPASITAAIDALESDSLGIRIQGMKDLQAGGDAAVVALINHLADPAKKDRKPAARTALINLGVTAVEEPLLAALSSSDDALRSEAAFILGKVKSKRAIEFLTGPAVDQNEAKQVRVQHRNALLRILGAAPTEEQAKTFLRQRVESFLDGEPPREVSLDDEIVLWQWNPTKLVPEPRTLNARDASLQTASQLATRLYAIDKDSAQTRESYLMALLEAEKSINGYGTPLASGPGTARANALSLGAAAVEQTLTDAIKADRIAAAIGAAEVLGDIVDEDVLGRGGRPRPLVQALRHPDRRVRFAAADSIMRLDPHRSFPGASYLTDALQFLAATHGERRAVVAHPRITLAQNIVAYLNAANIEAASATTGRGAFKAAAAQPDTEFLMISDAIDQPPANELVQMLRKDPVTARLPIAIMAREANLARLRSQFDEDPLTLVGPQPVEMRGALRTAQLLLQLPGRRFTQADERLLQARTSIKHLTHLLRAPQDYPFFDMLKVEPALIRAFRSPEFTEATAEALGLLATPAAQLALVEVASENARPLQARQAATKAFEAAVKRRGLLLTIPNIQRQYTRYNNSETLDADTQAVLGSVLDAIELPSKKQK